MSAASNGRPPKPRHDFTFAIPLLAPYEKKDVVKKAGAIWSPDLGVWMWPEGKPRESAREWLPLCYRDDLEPPYLLPDLIPESMWTENVRKYVSDAEWSRIRRQCRAPSNGFCRVCGVHNHPHCHEKWEFLPDPSGSRHGMQRLADLVGLCQSCHLAMHPGYATAQGRLNEALSHLANVNNWTMEEARAAYDSAGEAWERRNRYVWKLDCTLIEREFGIKVKCEPEPTFKFERRDVTEEEDVPFDFRHYFQSNVYPGTRSEKEPEYAATTQPATYSYRPAYSASAPRKGIGTRAAIGLGILATALIALAYMLADTLRHPHVTPAIHSQIVKAAAAATPKAAPRRRVHSRKAPLRSSDTNAPAAGNTDSVSTH